MILQLFACLFVLASLLHSTNAQCASFTVTGNVTVINGGTTDSFGTLRVDAGDELRYCFRVTRDTDGFTVAYNMQVRDDLRAIFSRDNLQVLTSTSTPLTMTQTPSFASSNVAGSSYQLFEPTGIFTGPTQVSAEQDVCFVIADDGLSSAEAGGDGNFFNGSPNNRDFMRRVRLDNGTKTNIGYLGDGDGYGTVVDAEAVAIVDPQTWIDPMSTRRVALVATERATFGDLGWSLRRGNSADCSNTNLACTCDNNVNCPPDYIGSLSYDAVPTGYLPDLFTPHGTAGVVRYYRRAVFNTNSGRDPNIKTSEAVYATSVSYTIESRTVADVDSLSMFPYFPYEMYCVERLDGGTNRFDVLFRLDTARFVSYAGTQLAAQDVFGSGIDGVEIYSRLINDIEAHSLPGAVLQPLENPNFLDTTQDPHTQRPYIGDVDDMAFSGTQPPTMYAIANQGSDPGSLLTVKYYDGEWVSGGPHPMLQACTGTASQCASPTSHASLYRFQDVDPVGGVGTCPENGQAGVRCEFTYPGSTLLRGGFGTPDFEGMSFSPDGRLHMVTGQQSSCPGYTTTPDDENPAIQIGDEGAQCLEGANPCNTAGFTCRPSENYRPPNIPGICFATPATVSGGGCTPGTPGCSCNTNANPRLRCAGNAGDLADGDAGRCIDVDFGGGVIEKRCSRPLNCFAQDNYLWQVDPLTGLLLQREPNYDLESSNDNYGDYEAIACETERPALDLGPEWFEVCYDAVLADHTPVSVYSIFSNPSMSTDITLTWDCSENPPVGEFPRVTNVVIDTPPLRRPVVRGSLPATDDDCTGTVPASGNPAVQFGEVFEVEVQVQMPEGTISNARLGVRLPAGGAVTVATGPPSSIDAQTRVVTPLTCGKTWTANGGSAPSVQVVTIDSAQFALLDFDELTNSGLAACSNNADNAQDVFSVRIALRIDDDPNLSRGDTFLLRPALIYDVVDPNNKGFPPNAASGTEVPPQGPYRVVQSDAIIYASSPQGGGGSDVVVELVEPSLATQTDIYDQTAPTVNKNQFREGETARICFTTTHTGYSDACAHNPTFSVPYIAALPPACFTAISGFSYTPQPLPAAITSCGTPSPTPTGSFPAARYCQGKLLIGSTLTACYTTVIRCPSPPPPMPTPTPPTPTPPTPPTPVPTPFCVQYETNIRGTPTPTHPGQRITSKCSNTTIFITPPVRLGDRVFLDNNRNGLQDSGDQGISGVTVQLLTAGGAPVATQATDANGYFVFSSVDFPAIQPNTAYLLRVARNQAPIQNPGYLPTLSNVGGSSQDNVDNDGIANGAINYDINPAATLGDGSFMDWYDFGFQPPLQGSQIGDRVWLDIDGDGVQDSGEPGIVGVTVVLRDTNGIVATTATVANGIYTFSNTPPGPSALRNGETGWSIQIDASQAPLARTEITVQNAGGNDNLDSDATPGAVPTITIPMTPADGDSNLTYDFGFRPLYIGNRVWRDNNANGLQDGGEPNLPNVELELVDEATSTVIASTTTNAQGEYYFISTDTTTPFLREGLGYIVRVVMSSVPATVQPTLRKVTPGPNDSNGDGQTPGSRPTYSLDNIIAPTFATTPDVTIDFGMSPCFRLGDRVWNDANRNGVQDASEGTSPQSVGGTFLFIWTEEATPVNVGSTRADANNGYFFDSCPLNLQSNEPYSIRIQNPQPGPLNASPPNQGGDDTRDSDGVPSGGDAVAVLDPATYGGTNGNNNDIDFGVAPPLGAEIGDFVWDDVDADGVQDPGEPGLSGVRLCLYTGDLLTSPPQTLPAPVATVVTDSNGAYRFGEAQNLQLNTQYTIIINMESDGTSCSQNPTNPLAPKSPSLDNIGTDRFADSNGVWQRTPNRVAATVTSGGAASSNITIDFGFLNKVVIGDQLWYDADFDGIQDMNSAESPGGTIMAGIPVTLYDVAADTQRTTQTDANGRYLFERRSLPTFLIPGRQYIVRVRVPSGVTVDGMPGSADILQDYQPTITGAGTPSTDNDGALRNSRSLAETAPFAAPAFGNEDLTRDFGFVPVLKIGDFVWYDAAGGGVQPGAMTNGIDGVTVQLWNAANTLVGEVITAGGGRYQFDSLAFDIVPTQTYRLVIPLNTAADDTRNPQLATPAIGMYPQQNYVPTLKDSSVAGDAADSDADFERLAGNDNAPSAIIRTVVAPQFGVEDLDFDFGFTDPIAIGDFVFADSDEDGIQDSGEGGIVNVAVRLCSGACPCPTSDTDARYIATVNTPPSGLYLFSEGDVNYGQRMVINQQYCVSIDKTQNALSNYRSAPQNQGGNDAVDSDASTTGTVANVPVPAVAIPPTAQRPRTDTSFDFGFIPLIATIRIGDRVFIDNNRDGLQDAGDTPPTGPVTVTLRPEDTNLPEMVTTTNATGYYEFVSSPLASMPNSVRPNQNYQIIIDVTNAPLIGHQATKNTPPGSNSELTDSNGRHLTRALVVADATTGSLGSDDPSYDFGFIPVYTVGDKVFSDTNGNGLQDMGEPGIPDVTVTLTGGLLPVPRSTVTDSNGEYAFRSLSPSDTDTWEDTLQAGTTYTISIRPGEVPRHRTSPPNQGMDDTRDSDGIDTPAVNPTSVDQPYTSTGNNDPTRDFGFIPELTLGDFVWRDANGDGLQTGELSNGIENVLVELYASDNSTKLGETRTDENGIYSFSSFDIPALTPNRDVSILIDTTQAATNGLIATIPNQGGVDTIDSDGVEQAGTPTNVWASATAPALYGGNDTFYDFGFTTTITLGDLVWADTDGDGTKGAQEPGIGNVRLELYSCPTGAPGDVVAIDASNFITSTVSGDGGSLGPLGSYTFSAGLLPNTQYCVVIDTNRAPILDQFQPTVRGTDPLSETDSNGAYLGNNGTRTGLVTSGVVVTGNLGQDVTHVDFGMVEQFNIGDFVWRDTGGAPMGLPDGFQTTGESGVANVRVELYAASAGQKTGSALTSVTTNTGGLYGFNSLYHNLNRNTEYVVSLPYRPGLRNFPLGSLQPTKTDATPADDTRDSDGSVVGPSGGTQDVDAAVTTQNWGEDILTIDFGFTQELSIGDYVWNDVSLDGLQNSTEVGIGGVPVDLYSCQTNPCTYQATAITDSGGFYTFKIAGLIAEQQPYRVAINASHPSVASYKPTLANANADGNDDIDSDATQSAGGDLFFIDFTSPAFGLSDLTLDFGLVNDLTIGDFIWHDVNANGIQEDTERMNNGIPSVTVLIADASGTLDTVMTSANGNYIFGDRLNQNTPYTIRVPTDQAALLDYQATPLVNTGAADRDSDVVRVGNSYEIAATTPSFGSADTTFDGGFVLRIKIGLLVWSDLNKNGVREGGDSGIQNVPVILTDDTFNQIGSAQTTNAAGEYRFDSFNYDIVPGTTYRLLVGVPNGFEPTLPNVGSDDTIDSDGVFDSSRTALVASFTPDNWGYVNETIDFGFTPVFRIGDFVWDDNVAPAGNGVQDENEPGLGNVIVRLFNVTSGGAPDTEVAQVSTTSGGLYEFNSFIHRLTAGADYIIQVAVPSGYQPTVPNAPLGGVGSDSDGVPSFGNAQVVQINITAPTYGVFDDFHDFGFVPTCSISGIAWQDDNGNGQQQTVDQSGSEPFLPGITVTLREVGVPANDVTTTTDQTGRFSFACYEDSIEPGKQYELIVNRTSNLKETTPNVPPELTDSDGVYDPNRQEIIISVVGPPYGTQSDDNDFGLVPVIRIGDYVWIDAEQPGAPVGHGTQEDGESPVVGATVLLYDGVTSTTPVAQVQTDANGFYEISSFLYDIRPGSQYVVAIKLDDTALNTPVDPATRPLTPTTPSVGGDNSDDSNGVTDVGRNEVRAVITAGAFGSNDDTIDFGFNEPPPTGITIGNFVWRDVNNNGLQDGEEGIEGVTVLLCNAADNCASPIATRTTGPNGQYLFNNQLPSEMFAENTDVIVRIVSTQGPLTGMRPGLFEQGADRTIDSNGDASTPPNVDAPLNTGADGNVRLDIDFAFIEHTFGCEVWDDLNGNGIFDQNEPPIANVAIELLDASGNPLSPPVSTTTNDVGHFEFSSTDGVALVENTDYIMSINLATLQSGRFTTTQALAGSNRLIDSNAVLSSDGTRANVPFNTRTFGTVDCSLDFGLVKLLTIGDYVFNDLNGDGQQDGGDTPRANMQVQLRDASCTTILANVTTDGSGLYLFTHVQHGLQEARSYCIVLNPTQTTQLVPSPTDPNDDPATDSNGQYDPANDLIFATTTTGNFGSTDETVDFGLLPLVEIGDYVWEDTNGDGIQGPVATEPPLPVGERVLLQDAAFRTTIAAQDIAADGSYLFSNRFTPALAPNTDYIVVFERNPPGFQLTRTGAGTAQTDSNGVYALGLPQAAITTPAGASSNLDLDFGFVRTITIGNRVWGDVNGNGCRDAGELGIPGVIVTLFEVLGNGTLSQVAQMPTNSNGQFSFSSRDHAGLLPNRNYQLVVGGSAPAIVGQAVSPTDACNDDSTDNDSGPCASGFCIPVTTGPPGEDRPNNDFGFVPPLLIGDFVWVDTNGNGLQDSGEPGVPNVVVGIYDQNNSTTPRLTTATNANGIYQFSSTGNNRRLVLQQNTIYDVRLVMTQDALAPYLLTTTDAQSNTQDTVDSDFAVDPNNDNIGQVTITSPSFGQSSNITDAGLVPRISLGDRVWDDSNGNGVQDPGEPGLINVLITLTCNGQDRGSVRSLTNGTYTFSRNVNPNENCRICVPLSDSTLAGLEAAPSLRGGDIERDSNGIVTGSTPATAASCADVRTGDFGSSNNTIDFGFTRGLSLGDFVWVDQDGEGDQDTGEPGIGNVVVELHSRNANLATATPLATVATNAQGQYFFTSAAHGVQPNTQYLIVISLAKNPTLDSDYTPTRALNAGLDDTSPLDSNGVYNPERTHLVAIASTTSPGVSRTTYDFGFVPLTCIGDYVWLDGNGNGLQDVSEQGIPNVPVTLYARNTGGSRGLLVCEATTNAAGIYRMCSKLCPFLIPRPEQYELVVRLTDTPNQRCTFANVMANAVETRDSDGVKTGSECVAIVDVPSYGSQSDDQDFGLLPELVIGDRLFIDSNNDGLDRTGVATETEPAVRGVTVQLLRNGIEIESTVSDNNGKYLFGDGAVPLEPLRQYRVSINSTQPALFELFPTKLSPPNTGLDAVDSNGIEDPNNDIVYADVTTRNYGQSDRTIDFGFRVEVETFIGKYIFIDEDHDGQRDDGEPGVYNVTVNLYRNDNGAVTFIASTKTDQQGRYEFSSKRDGFEMFTDYSIAVFLGEYELIGFVPTFPNEGQDDCRDSDALTQGAFAGPNLAMVINMTTQDYGENQDCNDFGVFDCVATDPANLQKKWCQSNPNPIVRANCNNGNNAGLSFTGEASTDFPNSNAYFVVQRDSLAGRDPFPDVGVPPQFPQGTISGWDMRAFYASFSPQLNKMFMGIDCFGICGDADGDGNPSGIFANAAGSSQYVDVADLGSTETFSVFIDLDQDGTMDIVMGVSSIVGNNYLNIPNSLAGCVGAQNTASQCGWSIYSAVDDDALDLGNRFGLRLRNYPVELYSAPSLAKPDLEWTVGNWSRLAGIAPNPFNWQVKFEVFAGSFIDGGIGEDRMPNKNEPGDLRFLCWEIVPEDLQYPNSRGLPELPDDVVGCSDHNCCNYGHGASCSDQKIRECVCAMDNFCCTTVWDQTCVARAAKSCTDCSAYKPGPISNSPMPTASCTPAPTSNTGNCCTVRRTEGGCSLQPYNDCVIAQDALCGSQWDQRCIDFIRTCSGNVDRQLCGGDPLMPTPAPTPAPIPSCNPGKLGCPCNNGACDQGQGVCDAVSGACKIADTCVPGTTGCVCAASSQCSESDARCSATNVCVKDVCTVGTVGCNCRTSVPQCDRNADNSVSCVNDKCSIQQCPAGNRGCACNNGACADSTLECKDATCQLVVPDCPAGTNMCPCIGGISCNAGFVCNAQQVCVLNTNPVPTPVPAGVPTPAPTGDTTTGDVTPTPNPNAPPTPAPVERPEGCVPGSNGCVCRSDGECNRGDAQCTDGRCVLPDATCALGELGCKCTADGSCADPSAAQCNPSTTRCEGEDQGREECPTADIDSDNDGIPDCQDDVFNIGNPPKDKDGNDLPPKNPNGDGSVTIDVYDPEDDGKTKVGSVTIPGKNNGEPKDELTGKDASGNDVVSKELEAKYGGKVSVPTTDGKDTVSVPVIDIDAGDIDTFTGEKAYLMICLAGDLPDGLSVAGVCLGALSDGATEWECVDNHVLPASSKHYCGYTTHLTRFAIIPKQAAQSLAGRDPLSALKAPLEPAVDEESGLPGWALGLIIALCVLCCLLIVLALACFFIRRNDGKSSSTSRSTRDDDDIAMGDVPRISTYEDRSVSNPAFDRDSAPQHATVVEELSDSSLSSSSSEMRGGNTTSARPGSGIEIGMQEYTTLRNAGESESSEEERGNSIIDMNTYKTLSNNQESYGNDQSAIDQAIFEALDSEES